MPIWRPVPGFPGYEVSNGGQVISHLPRSRAKGKYLKTCLVRGYRTTGLRKNKKDYTVRISRLVCLAFHGKPPTKVHEVAHGDGDRENDRASNLRWATHRENGADMIRHGRTFRGEKHRCAKLTLKIVSTIRKVHAAAAIGRQRVPKGMLNSMAEKFGVSHNTIQKVVYRATWKSF